MGLSVDVVLCASGDNDIPGYMVKNLAKNIGHLGLVVVAVVGVCGVGVGEEVHVVQPGTGVENVRGEVGVAGVFFGFFELNFVHISFLELCFTLPNHILNDF